MRRPQELAKEVDTMQTIMELTSVFEGIASMHIAQIRSKVLQSQEYFSTLWQIYSQLRVDNIFHFGRGQSEVRVLDKELYVAITAAGGFSGDIDQRLIKWMLSKYDYSKQEIVVIGHHGAIQLAQQGVEFKKYFKLPEQDSNMNVEPLVKEIQKYKCCTVFYQKYVSLATQDVKNISLSKAVQELSQNEIKKGDEIITDQNYIFEPSTYALLDHLERSMMQITLSQVILESKLAQYASRFRAMSAAHQKANDSLFDSKMQFNRAKRAVKDERLKETINSLRKIRLRV